MSQARGISETEFDAMYASETVCQFESIKSRQRHPEARRRNGSAGRVQGMHSRRLKRWTWGKGYAARVQDLQALARVVAVIVAIAVAGRAQAAPVNMATIGNPGNAANTTGLGAVGTAFKMARTEVSNAEYAAFLNSVDATGVNPRGIYNTLMGSGSNGGITFNAAAANGAKYVVKSGSFPGSPAGAATYANMPVNNVTWFSAARYMNWLQNGEQANATTMETGAYTLNNVTTGSTVARNANATYFIPTANEWYKAAFYNGSTYTTYQTNSNTLPASTLTLSTANAANYGLNTTNPYPTNVGAYANTQSFYGLFDMFGNVSEMTQPTVASATYMLFGGNFNATVASGTTFGASNLGAAIAPTTVNTGFGFRVAAVPEPSSVVLAVLGIAGLGGAGLIRRRRNSRAVEVSAAAGDVQN